MQFTFTIATLAATISVSLAQNFYLTNPVAGTTWKAADTVTIAWQNVEKSTMADYTSIGIEIVDGDSNNANLVQLISTAIPAKTTSYSYKVPSNLTPKTDYFLRMYAIGANGAKSYNYSARFAIMGGSPTAVIPESVTTTLSSASPSLSPKPTNTAVPVTGGAMKIVGASLLSILGAALLAL